MPRGWLNNGWCWYRVDDIPSVGVPNFLMSEDQFIWYKKNMCNHDGSIKPVGRSSSMIKIMPIFMDQYGTQNFIFRYGVVLWYRGWVETMPPAFGSLVKYCLVQGAGVGKPHTTRHDAGWVGLSGRTSGCWQSKMIIAGIIHQQEDHVPDITVWMTVGVNSCQQGDHVTDTSGRMTDLGGGGAQGASESLVPLMARRVKHLPCSSAISRVVVSTDGV